MFPIALVVDDHPASLEVARYLLSHEGFAVESATDGATALSLVRTHSPDVVVLDLDIPVIDGCELRDRMATDPLLASIPIVVVSVHEISEFCPDHVRDDFAGYIRKPLDPETFAQTVRLATRPSP